MDHSIYGTIAQVEDQKQIKSRDQSLTRDPHLVLHFDGSFIFLIRSNRLFVKYYTEDLNGLLATVDELKGIELEISLDGWISLGEMRMWKPSQNVWKPLIEKLTLATEYLHRSMQSSNGHLPQFFNF